MNRFRCDKLPIRLRPSISLPRAAGMAVCGLMLLASGSCQNGEESARTDESKPEAKPIVKTADRGPIKLTVTASADRITIAQRLNLKIEVLAGAGIEVTLPEFGAQITDFQVRDFSKPTPEKLDDGRVRYVQTYDLDIYLSGTYHIPPVTIQYADTRKQEPGSETKDDDTQTGELSTEGFDIEVTSLLKGQFDPNDFHDVKPVATVPRDRTWFWAWVVAGAVLVTGGAVAGGIWLVRRSRRPAPKMLMSPHDWAMSQLRELLDAHLIDEGHIKEFYYRLNEIARQYIELRFGLMAPERTTEEFLAELRSSDALPAEYRGSMEQFLAACDMVKYTLYEPGTEEIEQVFNAARDFIEQTDKHQPANQPSPMQEVAA